MRSRPDLIVPIRDRRQHKRILTLRNFGFAAIGVIVLFIALTVQSEFRHSKSENYGRLFGKQVSGQPAVVPQKVEVVHEAPVPDQTAADPLLIAPAAREQYLGVTNANAPQPVVSSSVVPPPPTIETRQGGVAIVGGPEGVTVAKNETAAKPTLSGGIFRQ
jgi:hypothetical protein